MSADNQQERLESWLEHHLAGFVDGEGCFTVSIKRKKQARFGWEFDPIFTVSQHEDRLFMLEMLQKILGCGKIHRKSPSSSVMVLYIGSKKDLIEHVIPFFDQYPLLAKAGDYQKFRKVVLSTKFYQRLNWKEFRILVKEVCSMNGARQYRRYSEKEILESSETIRQISS